MADVDPDSAHLLMLTTRRLDDLDRRIAGFTRQRERVRTVEERLMRGQAPTDQELVRVLTGLPDAETGLNRRITLFVYAAIATAQRYPVDVFGFAPGELTRDESGKVVHGEVFAGDGVIWMHREAEEHRLASPATLGAASYCTAVHVDDLDAHFTRVKAAGGEITQEPAAMPYDVREYGARDSEGGLWSFMEPLDDEEEE